MGTPERQLPGDIIDFDASIRRMPAVPGAVDAGFDYSEPLTGTDQDRLATVTELPAVTPEALDEVDARIADWASASALEAQPVPSVDTPSAAPSS